MIIMIWIISLIVLIASILFVNRMLITSNEFISSGEKSFPFKLFKKGSGHNKIYNQSLSVLQSRIKSLEDSNTYFEIQFLKFKLHLKENGSVTSGAFIAFQKNYLTEEEEDWKDLYYQENECKVQLENDLDETLQNLESANQEILKLKEEFQKVFSLKGTHNAKLTGLASMRDEIEVLVKN